MLTATQGWRTYSWETIPGNSDTILYLGGNEASTHKYISEALGKSTIDTRTHGQTKGRSGSYSTNFQMSGRELLTPDEVRQLDNRYAILFIRGAKPVMDLKYELTKHPAIRHTIDGGGPPYIHHQEKPKTWLSGDPLFAETQIHFLKKRRTQSMKNDLNHNKKFERRLKRLYAVFICLVVALTVTVVPALAADDPLTVVNNLSEFIFSLIRAVGLILLGYGILQVGLSLQSHDPSQRSNGMLTIAGGIVITFTN